MRNTNQYMPVDDTVVILLRSGKQILVDPESVEVLSCYTWCITGTGYAKSRTTGPAPLTHRLLAGAKPVQSDSAGADAQYADALADVLLRPENHEGDRRRLRRGQKHRESEHHESV